MQITWFDVVCVFSGEGATLSPFSPQSSAIRGAVNFCTTALFAGPLGFHSTPEESQDNYVPTQEPNLLYTQSPECSEHHFKRHISGIIEQDSCNLAALNVI